MHVCTGQIKRSSVGIRQELGLQRFMIFQSIGGGEGSGLGWSVCLSTMLHYHASARLVRIWLLFRRIMRESVPSLRVKVRTKTWERNIKCCNIECSSRETVDELGVASML